MHTKKNLWFSIILLSMLVALTVPGCGNNSPTSPDAKVGTNPNVYTAGSEQNTGNRLLWGIWQFQVNLAEKSIEIIPQREGMFHVNVVSLLEPVPLKFLRFDETTLEVDVPEREIEIDIILEHPLPGYPEYTGFDVRGILISDGSLDGLSIGEDLLFAEADETRLVNADGYTRWWNPTEFTGCGILGYNDGKLGKSHAKHDFTGTVNGFKVFADGLGLNDDVMQPLVLAGRGRFSSSSETRRHYSIKFGPEATDFMIFNYAVDASWEEPINNPPQSFDDFALSANSLEPFNIKVIENVNSLYYDPDLEDCPFSGGVLRINIEVATWQGEDGIDEVLVGSPDLGVDFFQATEKDSTDTYAAHIKTYQAEIVPDNFETYHPQVIVVATSNLGSYTSGPCNLPIQFTGSADAQVALYQVYYPEIGTNSPPVLGPVTGQLSVTAGDIYTYEVEYYYDCQDMNEDLVFSWEIGDNTPAEYNDGMGNTDGLHPYGDGSIDIIFPDEGSYVVDVMLVDLDGKRGYTEIPLEVISYLPPDPEFPPGGVNLELGLKRTILHSYEYTYNPSDIPYVYLSWDGSSVLGVTGEWVIYRDPDPFDSTETWKEIGTLNPEITHFENMFTGALGYNSGAAYYYKVKARSVVGNPNSEGTGSTEWAFIEFENAEISGTAMDQHPWSMGYGGYESAYYRQWERPGNGGAVTGGCWMMDPDSDYLRRHLWSVIASPELPILTDPVLAATTEEWYIELIFGAQIIPMNECWDNYGRLSVGTVPDDPATHTGQPVYYEYDESVPENYMDGENYYKKGYWSSINNRFDESPTTYKDRYGWGRDEYAWGPKWARFRLTDLDPNGTARTRAAIGFGSGTTSDAHARPRADEIAVIIY